MNAEVNTETSVNTDEPVNMKASVNTDATVNTDAETGIIMAFNSKYVLEHAAGTWWIIKCAQSPDRYTQPVPVNDSGADIFRGLAVNKTVEEIANQMSSEYGISVEDARQDVNIFVRQLATQGIV